MLEEKTTKKQNFLAGAAVLSLATMIVKVIGMFFKIPLNRLIGEANYGYFTTAYDIYTVLLMISTTGLPVAMSRMISEARALNNGKQVRQIYRVSLMAFLSIGIIGSALMLIIPKQLANMMENPNAMWSIFALGPPAAASSRGRGTWPPRPSARSSRPCASSSSASALPGSS